MKRSMKYAVLVIAVVSVLCGGLLIKGSINQVPSGTWALAGNMAAPRSGAATVLLADGRLLITGGQNGAAVLSSAEFFDTSGNLSAAATMNYARSKHSATVLQDGRVLVAGGIDDTGRAVATAEIYDPAANTWTVTGPLMVARSGHTASLLKDGTVLLAGGDSSGTPQNSLEVFDPASAKFNLARAALSSKKKFPPQAPPQGGGILVWGGFYGTNVLASSDIYDPSTGTVSAGPAMS